MQREKRLLCCSVAYSVLSSLSTYQHVKLNINQLGQSHHSCCRSRALCLRHRIFSLHCSRKVAGDQVAMRLQLFCPTYPVMTTVWLPHTHARITSPHHSRCQNTSGRLCNSSGHGKTRSITTLSSPLSTPPPLHVKDRRRLSPTAVTPQRHVTFHIQRLSRPKNKVRGARGVTNAV